MKNFIKIDLYLETSETNSVEKIDRAYLDSIETRTIFDKSKVKELDIKNIYVPNPGNVLFMGPGISIPRVKLKNLFLDHGVTCTRNITEATHIFLDEAFNDFVKTSWENLASVKATIQFLELIKEHLDEDEIEKVMSTLLSCTEDSVGVSWKMSRLIQDRDLDIYANVKTIYPTIESNKPVLYIPEENVEMYKYILANPSKLYSDASLMSHVNGKDSIIIDEKIYNQLIDMFKSPDSDNHIMAMEIMANSNYKESLMFIELLFLEMDHIISNCPTKRHVNFKSLVKYLDKNLSHLRTDIDDVVRSLIVKNVITADKLDFIIKYYKDQIVSDNEFFIVKEVTLNPELLEKLNINYKRNLHPDFIPKEIEETVIESTKSNEFSWM